MSSVAIYYLKYEVILVYQHVKVNCAIYNSINQISIRLKLLAFQKVAKATYIEILIMYNHS